MPESRYVSTAQVSRALGVSVTTIKRWVDGGILPAHKTAGGHRKLVLAEVLRLVRENDFPRLDLARLNLVAGRGVPPEPDTLAQSLGLALRRGDRDRVRALVLGAHEAGLALASLADRVIAPAVNRLGQEWASGRIDVLHEHRGTQVCAAALYELKARLDLPAERQRPLAVGGGPENDSYYLANLLAEMVLREAGWEAVNLGPHTPFAAFRRALRELKPRLLWLSASHLVDPAAFLDEYRGLYHEAERAGVALAVGGRALTEGVRAAMAYTTYGDGLTHLAAFARSLHPRPGRPRRGRPPRRPVDPSV
jgi:excisionase family DNA binding protein